VSGEKPIYTMKDILKYRKAAYLAARVSGRQQIDALKNLAQDHRPLTAVGFSSSDFEAFAKHFKPYLPGVTRSDMALIYFNFIKEQSAKRTKRRKLNSLGSPRLLPLSEEAYQNFAKYVWEKRGSPHFKKQIVSGCIWGKPQTIAYQDGENGKYEYVAGCKISTNLRGKKFLKLSIAG